MEGKGEGAAVICPDCGRPVETHAMFDPPRCPVIRINWAKWGREQMAAVGVFVCACGHPKASHRPHGGRRVPLSGWVCRKQDCDCKEYGDRGVTVEMVSE